MNERQFRNLFAILHSIDLCELEKAGVIKPGANGGSDWTRFKLDVGMFILKLDAERRAALLALCERRNGGPFA